MRATIARTAAGSIAWFLAENASMEGATTQSFALSSPSQAKARRENT